MALFVGLDVSVKETSVCVVDAEGQVLREARTATDPARIAGAIGGVEGEVRRVGLEAGPMAQWLTEGLLAAGLPVVCVETRHMAAALSAQRNKTDRNDARGIAHMMRMGWFRPVHVKTRASQEQRLLLASRRSLLEKLRALESELRGGLRTFGLRVGHASAGAFAERVRQLAAGRAALLAVVEPLLAARDALRAQLARLDRLVRDAAKADPACRLLMTAPGVGWGGGGGARPPPPPPTSPSASPAPAPWPRTSGSPRAATPPERPTGPGGSRAGATACSGRCSTRRRTPRSGTRRGRA
jgi:transposase